MKGGCENNGYVRTEELDFTTDEGMMRMRRFGIGEEIGSNGRGKGGGGSGYSARRRGSGRMGWVNRMYVRKLEGGRSTIQRLAILRAPRVRHLVKAARNHPFNHHDSNASPMLNL